MVNQYKPPEQEEIGEGMQAGKYTITEFKIKDSFSPEFDKILIAKDQARGVVHTTGKVLIKQFSDVNPSELPMEFTVYQIQGKKFKYLSLVPPAKR